MARSQVEFRMVSGGELRAAADGKSISGYGAVFNSFAQIGAFREVVKPGAFSRALREHQDVRALFNHDPNRVLGRTKSGTLTLREDGKGLFFRIELPDTDAARGLHASIDRGDIDGCSFGFACVKENWPEAGKNGGQRSTRELLDVDLFDVGPVTFPAYAQTSVDARSLVIDGEPRSVGCYVLRASDEEVSLEIERQRLKIRSDQLQAWLGH